MQVGLPSEGWVRIYREVEGETEHLKDIKVWLDMREEDLCELAGALGDR
jgi:hypothetical protein